MPSQAHTKIVLKMGVALFSNKVKSVIELGELLISAECDELTNAGVWIWEVETDKVFYSPKFCETLGYNIGDFGDSFKGFEQSDSIQFNKGIAEINELIATF